MAITFGTIQTGTSATTSLTIASGTDKLVVAVASRNLGGSSPTDISGITFNGSALTEILRQYVPADSNAVVTEFWYIDNPTATTANLVISWTTSPSGGPISVIAWPLTGAASGAAEASASASNWSTATPSQAITTLTDGAVVLDSAVHNRDSFTSTAGGSQTQDLDHGDADGGAGMRHAASHRTVATAGSVTDDWTWSSNPNQQVMAVVSIAPSGGGGGATTAHPKVNATLADGSVLLGGLVR